MSIHTPIQQRPNLNGVANEKMRKALASLNLTDDQKTQIQGILKTAYSHHQGQSKENSQ